MAQGYDRNSAKEIAAEAVIAYGSYAKGYEQTLQIKSAIENLNVSALLDVIEKFCITVAEASAAFAQTFKDAYVSEEKENGEQQTLDCRGKSVSK